MACQLPVLANGQAHALTPVDLELVIAVDVSLSMDLDEQRLQRDGYVAALRHEDIHKAIASGPHGRIAIVYMEWAGPPSQNVVIPWTLIDGPAAAIAIADRLEATPISRARMTSISTALEHADILFAASGFKGIRRVVDVSGDGPNNAGRPVTGIRDALVAKGIVINGLPIILKTSPASFFDLQNLDTYYADCVIGGAGAFMVPVRSRSELQIAIRRKLLLEIAYAEPPPLLVHVQASGGLERPASDCLIGEKQWQHYLDGRLPN
jgi:hypothetical protein